MDKMNNDYIDKDIFEVAIKKSDGNQFERFACDFMSALEGREFIPLGGIHDGGADGFISKEIFEAGGSSTFYQITIQSDHKSKIRKTIGRLKEFGRTTRILYYITSKTIPHIDREEDLLTDELGVIVKIRDERFISSHVNDSIGTKSAYYRNLSSNTDYLSRIGSSVVKPISEFVSDPSVFVFLQHEISNKLGNRKVMHSIMDTLILWSLKDTDPDSGIFLDESQIKISILESFPWTKSFINNQFKNRLEQLRTKSVTNREIRWYKKDKKYCLPYETRYAIKLENTHDELLHINFIQEIKDLCRDKFSLSEDLCQSIAPLVTAIIQKVFERQGLLLSSFISEVDGNLHEKELVISDCIEDVLENSSVKPCDIYNYRVYIEGLIRDMFYHSTEIQREYLLQLSKTYVLLFTLKAEPRIVDYFNAMSSKFTLFLGSDIIVKALSERYLKKEDQQCKNLLQSAAASGVNFRVSNAVLDEIYTHIRNSNFEFNNHFREVEQYITVDIARNSSKILIRAYFYAKKAGHTRGWNSFLNQFISVEKINTDIGKDELKKYLISEYSLKFIEDDELESCSNENDVKELAKKLVENDDKKNSMLAYNSALLVHGIYGLRRRNNEANNGSPFGYGTWWLTSQTKIQKHTVNLVNKNLSKYIMRPEFLLNFLSLSPSAEQVRKTYGNIFPSNLGIQFGHRLKESVFHDVLSKVKEWATYEPGRVSALVANLSDELKSDQHKKYEQTLKSLHGKVEDV